MTMLAIFTVCLVGMVNLVFGQTFEVNISDNGDNETVLAVDKLINDTKQQVAKENQYKTEIINRIQNSTCLSVIGYDHTLRGGRGYILTDDPIYKINLNLGNTTQNLEDLLKRCVAQGLIK